MFMKKLKKKCVVCGKKLDITIIDAKGHYTGGYYFGRMKFYRKYRDTGRISKLGKLFGKSGAKIVSGVGKPKEVEYWECGKCFIE